MFMRVNIAKSKNAEQVYIIRSYRKNGKSTSSIYKKLGTMEQLIQEHGSREEVLAWANKEAEKETIKYNEANEIVTIAFNPSNIISKDYNRTYNVGYLFLQQLYYDLQINKIMRNIRDRYHFDYDINEITRNLTFSRILDPSSKRSSYEHAHCFLDKPSYSLDDSYRALSILAQESDYIQSELFKNSNFITKRDVSCLYYDCTNYFFEIEVDDDFRKYGKGKEHRPNPIVTMGLFMDSKGIPIAFDMYEGSKNEQLTLKPLEEKVIRSYDIQEFIFCSDSGLASKSNKLLNSIHNRKYVITQSLKKMKKDDAEWALNPTQFRQIGRETFIDISKLDESKEDVYNNVYYKEFPGANDDEIIIVTYSPKYKYYQQSIREKQIARAKEWMTTPGKLTRNTQNQNDPKRFCKEIRTTDQGEVANQKVFELDIDRIVEEAKYDGFYAVCTNLNDNVRKVIEINKKRWEIEECFRILKTDFKARPIYVQRQDRIKAHFLICFIALLILRILEEKTGHVYTVTELLATLRSMNVINVEEHGYIPAYTRTEITDTLHNVFGFRTDNEIIKKAKMRNIISQTKNKK